MILKLYRAQIPSFWFFYCLIRSNFAVQTKERKKRRSLLEGMVVSPGMRTAAASPVQVLVPNSPQSVNFLPQPHLGRIQEEKFRIYGEGNAKFSSASWRYVQDNPRPWSNLYAHPASYSEDGRRNNTNGMMESRLFSSSLSETFSRKCRNDVLPQRYNDTAASCYETEEPFVSTKEVELQTIGNLLPDENDLFSGIIEDLECTNHVKDNDEEDFDLFSSGGGIELEGDNCLQTTGGFLNGQGRSNGSLVCEHPHGEDPSRTLFVRNINSSVEDSELRILFEQYGDIQTLYTACKHRGFVMISYYDIRAATNAKSALQDKPLRRRKLDIHYSIPKDNLSGENINQGTLTVSNLDSSVSNAEIRQIFGNFGEIKEIHATPQNNHDTLIEYHDIRAAEAALRSLNGSSIAGKQVKLEISYSGAARQWQLCCCDFGSSGSGSVPLYGHSVSTSSNSFKHHAPSPMIWSSSPQSVNGGLYAHCACQNPELCGVTPHVLNAITHTRQHHIGSAPAINPPSWDMQHAYMGKSPKAQTFHLDSPGNVGLSSRSSQLIPGVAPRNIFSHAGRNSIDIFASSALCCPQLMCRNFPRKNAVPSNERMRNLSHRRYEADSFDKRKYELDVDRVLRKEDNRTTLMIRNIPNKYTSKMLLAAIDEQHRGTYDFIYLPIDFKASTWRIIFNKCNMGYAFINMIDPLQIIPFHETFNGRKWEKFHSEKVATLAYARIQGKAALIAHFQNSSLMNEDKRCRPILLHTDGPHAGDQEPFPLGATNRSRPESSVYEQNYSAGIRSTSVEGEKSFNGVDLPGSARVTN
ncbi:hypothetical protein RJ639_016102 [Escallonia herrerae]|uniref:RRM domain-containing protein n=1 Tax=Escallonia herrerae TaxID=1293975 RepID=A0AA88VGN6_9ASTE|nr:hypothetical protein RJ639_016102 [Escallonia herrerae]